MAVRRAFGAVFRGRRTAAAARSKDGAKPTGRSLDPATLQVFAHTLIADLFGAGLRLQTLAASAPEDMQQALEELADQLDKSVREVREFAFTHRS